jgi:hypothetical protein
MSRARLLVVGGHGFPCGTEFRCWICGKPIMIGRDQVWLHGKGRHLCTRCLDRRLKGLV